MNKLNTVTITPLTSFRPSQKKHIMRIMILLVVSSCVLSTSIMRGQSLKNSTRLSLEINYNPEVIFQPNKSTVSGNLFDGKDIGNSLKLSHNFSIGLRSNFKSNLNYNLALLFSSNRFIETIGDLEFSRNSTESISYTNSTAKFGVALGPSFRISDKLHSKLILEGGRIFYADNSYELIEEGSAVPLSGSTFDRTEEEENYFANIKGELNRKVASNKSLDFYVGISLRYSLTPVVYRMANKKMRFLGTGLNLIIVI